MADGSDPEAAGVDPSSFMPSSMILRNPITRTPFMMHFERTLDIRVSAPIQGSVSYLISQSLECKIIQSYFPKFIKVTMAGEDLRKLHDLVGVDLSIIADGECIWLKPLHELVSGARYRINEQTKETSCLFKAELPTTAPGAFEGYFLPNATNLSVKLEGLPEAALPLQVTLDVHLELGLYQAEKMPDAWDEVHRPASPPAPPDPRGFVQVFVVARVSMVGDPAIYGVYTTRELAERARADAGGVSWEIFIRRLDVLPAVS